MRSVRGGVVSRCRDDRRETVHCCEKLAPSTSRCAHTICAVTIALSGTDMKDTIVKDVHPHVDVGIDTDVHDTAVTNVSSQKLIMAIPTVTYATFVHCSTVHGGRSLGR